jgi:ParB/RepB/Spo0J family partition protein
MPSGEYGHLSVYSITIPEDRQRRDLPAIPELAESIRNRGLIHAPVVTREHVLVSGRRRMAAIAQLGWTHVTVQWADTLDPKELRAIELEENIKRVDLSWQDRSKAIKDYDDLRRSEDPTWTQEKTGEALGLAQANVSRHIAIATEIAKGNQQVIEAPKFSVASNMLKRKAERASAAESEQFARAEAAKPQGADGAISCAAHEPYPESIITADFLQWASVYDGPRFNLIHCDFPYGIDYDKSPGQNSARIAGTYDDSENTYWRLVGCLSDNLDRIASESSHLVFWFSMKFYRETLDAIRNMDFECDGFPLLWFRSDNSGLLPDPERGPRRVYETAFLASRGDRKIVSAVANTYAAPMDRSGIHVSIKPEPVLKHFFRMLVDEHTRLLDPTCGSGTALRAAEGLGAKNSLGIEADAEFADRAREALIRARTLRAVA